MNRIVLLGILVGFFGFGYGQNWMPFDTTYTYNYLSDDATYIEKSYKLTLQNDTTYFETIIDSCDTCINNVFLLNQADIFGYYMINHFDSVFTFYGNDTVTIKPLYEVGESWDYTNNITATVISKHLQQFDTLTDSVKTILLSNNDTLKIAKTFGIIQFPYLTASTIYIQVGVENQYGLQNLTFWEVFDFDVGDVLQYKDYETSVDFQYTGINFHKFTILEKYVDSSNGYNYVVDVKKRIAVLETIHGTTYENYLYFDYIDTLDFIINDDTLLSRNTGEWFKLDNYSYFNHPIFVASYYKYDVNNILTKIIDIPPYLGDFWNGEGFLIPYGTNHCRWIYFERRIELKKGLGMTLNEGSFFEDYFITELMGYYKGLNTVGVVYADDYYVSINDQQPINNFLRFYPNPSNGQLHFELMTKEHCYVELINSKGQLMKNISITNNQTIDISDLTQGLYFLKVYNNKNEFGVGKLVVE